jgi:hypothetical protein
MYKVIGFGRFKSGLTNEQARDRWIEVHGSCALAVPLLRSYVQDHWERRIGGGDLSFNGQSETAYDSEDDYIATMSGPWTAVLEDGATLFDMPTTTHGIVDEYILKENLSARGHGVKALWTLRFKRGLSAAEARSKWLDSTGPITLRVPGLLRYEQNHAAKAPYRKAQPFDGRIDGFFSLWFENSDALEFALQSKEWRDAFDALHSFCDVESLEGVVIHEYIMR